MIGFKLILGKHLNYVVLLPGVMEMAGSMNG